MDKEYYAHLSSKRALQGYDHEKELTNVYNYQYFGTLFVGTHHQEMTFIFDTGSSWTWVPNADCPDEECARRHYDYSKSTQYRNTENKETVRYGSGEIEGFVVTDDIALSASNEY